MRIDLLKKQRENHKWFLEEKELREKIGHFNLLLHGERHFSQRKKKEEGKTIDSSSLQINLCKAKVYSKALKAGSLSERVNNFHTLGS